jgi:hypothetical protein
MDTVILVLAAAILVGGGFYIWTRRRPKMSGAYDASVIERGEIPAAWLDALRDMEQRVGAAVSAFYGKSYTYNETWPELVNRVQIVDTLPNGALGEMMRTSDGIRTLVLTRSRLNDLGHLQHELLHSLTWNHPELWDQCVKYPGDHWPLIFRDLIGD